MSGRLMNGPDGNWIDLGILRVEGAIDESPLPVNSRLAARCQVDYQR